MPSAGNNVNAYETGCEPFKPDENRGKWPSKWPFYFATISQGFYIWNFVAHQFMTTENVLHGVVCLFPYFLGMIFFTLPIIFIQSSLGQFTSTGFISTFRMVPLFKGIGYVICFLNIYFIMTTFSYAHPLIYLLVSLTPYYPWLSCNNTWNSPNCTEVVENDKWWEKNYTDYTKWSTDEYYKEMFYNRDAFISPYFLGCAFLFWTLIAMTLFDGIKSFSKVIVFTGSLPIGILVILLIRASFVPGISKGFLDFFFPTQIKHFDLMSWASAAQEAQTSFGSGWGVILTLTSFNNFRTDVVKYSINICAFHILIMTICVLFMFLLHEGIPFFIVSIYGEYEHLFVPFPYFFEMLEVPGLWMILFCLMLFLIQFNVVTTELFVTLISLFDEFEILRRHKRKITIGSCFFLFLGAIFCRINIDELHYVMEHLLPLVANFNRALICLLELFIVLWIYGRLRFRRDIEFMLNRKIGNWIFFLMRFVTPCFLFCTVYILFMVVTHRSSLTHRKILTYSIKATPAIVICGYIAYTLLTTTGSFLLRLKRSIRPTDWYPADPTNRQKYEEILNSADMTQQLTEFPHDLENN